LRNTDQDAVSNVLLQQAYSRVHAQLFGDDRPLEHDCGVNVGRKGAVGHQEVCPPAEPAKGKD
jgi:hypothetical protein